MQTPPATNASSSLSMRTGRGLGPLFSPPPLAAEGSTYGVAFGGCLRVGGVRSRPRGAAGRGGCEEEGKFSSGQNFLAEKSGKASRTRLIRTQ